MSQTLLLAAGGEGGTLLTIPAGVELLPVGREVTPGRVSYLQQRDLIDAAIAPLKQIASGRRRAAIVVGDISLPAPYEYILPRVVEMLVAAEIRPTRISFFAYPGSSSTLLGRDAIRRYGEEIAGNHELRNWQAGVNGEPDLEFAAADLRVAIGPAGSLAVFEKVDANFAVTPGSLAKMTISKIELNSPDARPAVASQARSDAPVFITSGGDTGWQQTLEEALISLHVHSPQTETVVLAFSGEEGLGSARFANDFAALLPQAEEMLQAKGELQPMQLPRNFDPAGTLANCLVRHKHVVLFSPSFCAHPEGEQLLDDLVALPKLAERFHVCRNEAELWQLLGSFHGAAYHVFAEPLGWRSLYARA